MPLDSTFSYSNAPHAILPRKKYRNEDDSAFTLMSDPRVMRGSVTRSLKGNSAPGSQSAMSRSLDRTAAASKPGKPAAQNIQQRSFVGSQSLAREERESERSHRPAYVYRVNELVQPEIDLSQYLVEREPETKRPPKLAETQTDDFQERPDTPEYVPRKTGVDMETQVENVSDLFIFDLEVEPMLSVICKKTLEQAMFEIERESELVNLQDECDRFAAIRVVEDQWHTAKEQQTLADSHTKDLALQALEAKAQAQGQVRRKVAGGAAMRQMLPALVQDVCGELYAEGVWKDPETDDIDKRWLEEVYVVAKQNLELYKQAQSLVDEMLMQAFEGKASSKFDSFQQESMIKLMASGKLMGTNSAETATLGFIAIDSTDTVLAINRKINRKLEEEGLKLKKEVDVHGFLALALGVTPEELNKASPLPAHKLPEMMNIVLPDDDDNNSSDV